MQEQILKFVDESHGGNTGITHYILHPERIIEIQDTKIGCKFRYAGGYYEAEIKGTNARQFKRAIQEQLNEPMGFLKTEFPVFVKNDGLRYFNVNRIAAVRTRRVSNIQTGEVDLHSTLIMEDHKLPIELDHEAFEVAYQIRRVLKRLDQDSAICCTPEPTPEE